MVNVTPLIKTGTQVIQSYAGGRFKVSGEVYDSAIVVTPTETRIWPVSDFAHLEMKDFEWLFTPSPSSAKASLSSPRGGEENSLSKRSELRELGEGGVGVDIVLLGTGSKMQFLPVMLRNALKEKGVSVDVMDTGAACRTYNVLVAEGRRVAAALLTS